MESWRKAGGARWPTPAVVAATVPAGQADDFARLLQPTPVDEAVPGAVVPGGLISSAEQALACVVCNGPLAGLQLRLDWRDPRLRLSLQSADAALRQRLQQRGPSLAALLGQCLGVRVELVVTGDEGE